jgi:WXXGXW repeat (2 copies)
MKQTLPRIAFLFAVAALAGCAVVPAYDYAYEQPSPVTVYAAPPAPLVEYRGLSPAFGYVWIDGYWNWGGVRYSWVPGRWVNPPPGQVWVPRVWQRDGERWHSQGGHWHKQRGYQEYREYPRPAPPQAVWPRREHQPQPFSRLSEPLQQPELARRAERPQARAGEQRLQPPVLRHEPARGQAEAAAQRRAPDENRDGRRPRKWPEDGEQRDQHRVIP